MNVLFPTNSTSATLAEIYMIKPNAPPTWRSNMVTSLNGAIEINGVSKALSSNLDREAFWIIRAFADGIVIGSNTAIKEGYTSLPSMSENLLKLRRSRTAPELIVVTNEPGKLKNSNLVNSDSQVIIVTSKIAKADAVALAKSFKHEPHIWAIGDQHTDLPEIKRELAFNDIRHVVLEGGPSFLGGCIENKVVDEIALSVSPILAPNHFYGFLGEATSIPVTKLEMKSLVEEKGNLLILFKIVN